MIFSFCVYPSMESFYRQKNKFIKEDRNDLHIIHVSFWRTLIVIYVYYSIIYVPTEMPKTYCD